MMKWYIVQSYSGFEKKVSEQIKEELDKADLSDHFDQVLVPTQDVTEIKKGKKTIVKKKYFPGYVLAKMIMTDHIVPLVFQYSRQAIADNSCPDVANMHFFGEIWWRIVYDNIFWLILSGDYSVKFM